MWNRRIQVTNPTCNHDYNMEEEFMKNKKEDELQQEFNEKLPCKNCTYESICKYAGTFTRINYNANVFEVTVKCKTKDQLDLVNYRGDVNEQRERKI